MVMEKEAAVQEILTLEDQLATAHTQITKLETDLREKETKVKLCLLLHCKAGALDFREHLTSRQ